MAILLEGQAVFRAAEKKEIALPAPLQRLRVESAPVEKRHGDQAQVTEGRDKAAGLQREAGRNDRIGQHQGDGQYPEQGDHVQRGIRE